MVILSQKLEEEIDFRYTGRPTIIMGVGESTAEVDAHTLVKIAEYFRQKVIKANVFDDCEVILLDKGNGTKYNINIKEVE